MIRRAQGFRTPHPSLKDIPAGLGLEIPNILHPTAPLPVRMGAKGRNRYREQRVWQDYKARGLVQVMVQGNPQTEVPQLVSPSLWVTFHCHTPTRTPSKKTCCSLSDLLGMGNKRSNEPSS